MPENALRSWHLVEHLARSTGPCIERTTLDQHTPAGLPPAQRCCVPWPGRVLQEVAA